jgi:ribulose-bisphosphate carboxylase large chain
MTIQELTQTLNSHQLAYVNLELKNPQNGEYMLCAFHLIPGGTLNILQAACEVSAESSTGTNFLVNTETPFSKEMNALVYQVDLEKSIVYIAYPTRLFDRNGNIQNILTYIVGNVLGMKEINALKLLDVWFPPAMLEQYDGPSYTIDDMRKYLNVYGRPILGTIIKPKMGLTSAEYAEVCYDFWTGGGDFVKNDEPQADQDFCPYDKMVLHVKEAMDKSVKETGKKKVHSFNVSAADYETMIKRCEMIKNAGFEPGSYAFLIDGTTAGWMAVQTLRRKYPDVFIHFHRAGHGAFTRKENPIGFTVLILSKFASLDELKHLVVADAPQLRDLGWVVDGHVGGRPGRNRHAAWLSVRASRYVDCLLRRSRLGRLSVAAVVVVIGQGAAADHLGRLLRGGRVSMGDSLG